MLNYSTDPPWGRIHLRNIDKKKDNYLIYSHLLNKISLIRKLLFENSNKFTNLHLYIVKPSPTLVELLYKEETFIKILIEYLSRQSFLVCWKSFYETDLDQISIRTAEEFSGEKLAAEAVALVPY